MGLSRRDRKILLSRENVIGYGYGQKIKRGMRTGEDALIVFVTKKMPKGELRVVDIIPDELEGIPTDVIELGEVKALGERIAQVRPALPGMSIGNYRITAGTFGAVVRDISTGEPLILSNNHVLANASDGNDGRCVIGDPILQPGAYDGGTPEKSTIGKLYRFVPLHPEAQASSCRVAKRAVKLLNALAKISAPEYRFSVMKKTGATNTVDCAVAKPVDPKLIKDEILELGKVNGTGTVKVGSHVRKSGRTTGVTDGKVIATEAELRVDMGEGRSCLFTNQCVAEMISRGGDSGSIVLDDDNRAVGLLFAASEKYTIFNPIEAVLKELRVKI